MPTAPIVDNSTVLGWTRRDATIPKDVDSALLDRCIIAASEFINEYTSRLFALSTIDEWHSSCSAQGSRRSLLLSAFFPVASVTSLSISGANETTLLVPPGPLPASGTGTVCLADTGMLERIDFASRQNVAWPDDILDVRFQYKAGYAPDSVPESIVQACVEIAWVLYQTKDRPGIERVSKPGGARDFVRGLSELSQQALETHRRWGRQTTAKTWSVS